jgi:hypothetical protein
MTRHTTVIRGDPRRDRARAVRWAVLFALAAAQAVVPVRAAAPRLEVYARVAEDGRRHERAVAPGAVLRSGDEVRLEVTVWEDAYLYVVALGSSGTAVLLHPLSGDSADARVQAADTVVIPADGGHVPLDGRTGRESFFAFTTAQPLDTVGTLLTRIEAGAGAGDLTAARRSLLEQGLDPAHLAFGHADPRPLALEVSNERPQTAALAAASVPATDSQAAPGRDPGVLGALGNGISGFTGGSFVAQPPAETPAMEARSGRPIGRPKEAASAPADAPRPDLAGTAPGADGELRPGLEQPRGSGGGDHMERPPEKGSRVEAGVSPLEAARDPAGPAPLPSPEADPALAVSMHRQRTGTPTAATAGDPRLGLFAPPPGAADPGLGDSTANTGHAPSGHHPPGTGAQPVPAMATEETTPASDAASVVSGPGYSAPPHAAAALAVTSAAAPPAPAAAAGDGMSLSASRLLSRPSQGPGPTGSPPAAERDDADESVALVLASALATPAEPVAGGAPAITDGGPPNHTLEGGPTAEWEDGDTGTAVEPAARTVPDPEPLAAASAMASVVSPSDPDEVASGEDTPAPDPNAKGNRGRLAGTDAFVGGGAEDAGETASTVGPAAPPSQVPAAPMSTVRQPSLERRVDASGRDVVVLDAAPMPRPAESVVLSASGSKIRALLGLPQAGPAGGVPSEPSPVSPATPVKRARQVGTTAPESLEVTRTASSDPAWQGLPGGAATAARASPALPTVAPPRVAGQALARLVDVDLEAVDGPAAAVVLVVTPDGSSSGVVLDAEGHLLTNWRGVRGYDVVVVYFKSRGGPGPVGATRARVLGHSKFADLALLRAEAPPPLEGIPPIVAGVEMEQGALVHAIGHGAEPTWQHVMVTVDRVRPDSSWYSLERVLHRGDVLRCRLTGSTDLSGAPLFNDRLELVGLAAVVRADKQELIGVSADTIRAFLGPPG